MSELADATPLPAYFTLPQVFWLRATGDLQTTLRLKDARLVQANWREERRSGADPSFVQQWDGPEGLHLNANFEVTMEPIVERCRKGQLKVRGRNNEGTDEVISQDAWARCSFFLSDGEGFVAESGNPLLASLLRTHRAGYDVALRAEAKAKPLWTDLLLPAQEVVQGQPAPSQLLPTEGDVPLPVVPIVKRRRGPYEAGHKALTAITACFPEGVPMGLQNPEIVRRVEAHCEKDGKRPPSPDTILRAAGRK